MGYTLQFLLNVKKQSEQSYRIIFDCFEIKDRQRVIDFVQYGEPDETNV